MFPPLLPLYYKKQSYVLQLEEKYEDVQDSEYHSLLKRYIKNTNNAAQDIIDAAKRLEEDGKE